MANTIVKLCTCEHIFQDKHYGKKLRLMNVKKDEKVVKCTVCGKDHNK